MSHEKVAVVTGANKGIGYEILKGLCERFDGVVYLTARDVGRGRAAVKQLNKLSLKPEFRQLDVTSQGSIQDFAQFIKDKHGGIDVLVNNAGIAFDTNAPNPVGEQAEVTIATNFFALLYVCHALFPLLRPHARVVNLSSCLGSLSWVPGKQIHEKFLNPNMTEEKLGSLMIEFVESAKRGDNIKDGWGKSAYVISKVGVSVLTFIQHRQFLTDCREDIAVNCVHPGYVKTDMTNHKGAVTPEEGAKAPLYLALLPANVSSPKGEYVWYDKRIVSWVKPPSH